MKIITKYMLKLSLIALSFLIQNGSLTAASIPAEKMVAAEKLALPALANKLTRTRILIDALTALKPAGNAEEKNIAEGVLYGILTKADGFLNSNVMTFATIVGTIIDANDEIYDPLEAKMNGIFDPAVKKYQGKSLEQLVAMP